jgi:hypothetical protein
MAENLYALWRNIYHPFSEWNCRIKNVWDFMQRCESYREFWSVWNRHSRLLESLSYYWGYSYHLLGISNMSELHQQWSFSVFRCCLGTECLWITKSANVHVIWSSHSHWSEKSCMLGVQKIMCFSCLEMETEPSSETLGNRQSPNNEDCITKFII